jgi:hypothetical protein
MGIYKWHIIPCYGDISHISDCRWFVIWLSFVLDCDRSNNMGTHGSLENLVSQDLQRGGEPFDEGYFKNV